MNIGQLLKLHEDTCNQCREVMKKKNHDYTSGSADPFANFRASELMGVPAEKGILVRTIDKMQRMKTFVELDQLQVDDESIDDAIDDTINYMILLKGLIRERKENTSTTITIDGELYTDAIEEHLS